jgi:hypothetical protein
VEDFEMGKEDATAKDSGVVLRGAALGIIVTTGTEKEGTCYGREEKGWGRSG